ncbi:MAG: sodium:solute symporter [bacterium]|nr:sodium:solute symporter [bacterium]
MDDNGLLSISIAPIDLLVLGSYLAGAVLLGVWIGRGQRDLSSYLLGSRDVAWWAILGSIVATETSTATFLSVPGLAYQRETGDMRFLQLTFGYVVGRCIIVYLLLPLFFRGQLYTAYEVLHKRFGGKTKKIASLIFLVTRNLGDGLRLFLTAIALKAVLGWPIAPCVVLIGIATIIYTVFGGMKSVIWNDCIQMVIYMVGGLLAGYFIISALPEGWQSFVDYGRENGKFRVLDFSWDLSEPFTFWAGMVGGMFLTLGTHGTDQLMVQRYLSARTEQDAGRALVVSGFAVMIQFVLFLLLGVGLAAFYDLVRPEVQFERADDVFANFIVSELPSGVGIIGLLLAAVFAAAMSTLSSSLNSSASAVVNDFYVPWKFSEAARGSEATERKLMRVSRLLTVFFGIVQIGIGIAAEQLSRSVVADALAIAGFSAGLLLGVFCLGVFTKSVDERACLFGLACGLVVLLSIHFVFPRLDVRLEWPITLHISTIRIAWPWYALIGASTTFLSGWLAARLQGSGGSADQVATPD